MSADKPPPRQQCKACPWKKSTNPRRIPDGYSARKHARLKNTIAQPGEMRLYELRVMACHETPVGEELPCVGWLHHQMGVGNNIALRMAVMAGVVDSRVETVGAQHQRFEDTLPKRK